MICLVLAAFAALRRKVNHSGRSARSVIGARCACKQLHAWVKMGADRGAFQPRVSNLVIAFAGKDALLPRPVYCVLMATGAAWP